MKPEPFTWFFFETPWFFLSATRKGKHHGALLRSRVLLPLTDLPVDLLPFTAGYKFCFVGISHFDIVIRIKANVDVK
jgi:hypothetical protein